MNAKHYVSLEVAKMLKELGYNEETSHYYNSAGKLYLGNGYFNYNAYAFNLSAPSKSEAIDWLESKGIVVEVFSARIGENRKWCYSIINTKTDITIETPYKFSTRLEAEEAAIIKACELL